MFNMPRYLVRTYQNLKYKREFNRRIGKLNSHDYLITSNALDLNVIILAIDCLRNSQLSYNGYIRKTTPFLDSFGLKFKAITSSCWTYPAVASMLTGLYPHNHNAMIGGKVKNFDRAGKLCPISEDILTLPELLGLLKYRVYFGAAIDLAFYPFRGRVVPKLYNNLIMAKDVLIDFLKWIRKSDGRFFAYLHLGDLHVPLNPPDDFKDYFGKVKNLQLINSFDFRRPEEQRGDGLDEYRANRVLLYDNALRYVDSAIEGLHRNLEDLGLLDSTVFVITADHGEEFWEHADTEAKNFYDPRGYYGVGHGHNVFNEIIEVPLLISAPGIHCNKSRFAVSTVDIMPTVLNLLGVEHNLKFDGCNIFDDLSSRFLLCEAMGYGYEKKVLIIGNLKLIYSPEDGVAWLFDLSKDPEELHPITDGNILSDMLDILSTIYTSDEKKRIRDTIKRKRLSTV